MARVTTGVDVAVASTGAVAVARAVVADVVARAVVARRAAAQDETASRRWSTVSTLAATRTLLDSMLALGRDGGADAGGADENPWPDCQERWDQAIRLDLHY